MKYSLDIFETEEFWIEIDDGYAFRAANGSIKYSYAEGMLICGNDKNKGESLTSHLWETAAEVIYHRADAEKKFMG